MFVLLWPLLFAVEYAVNALIFDERGVARLAVRTAVFSVIFSVLYPRFDSIRRKRTNDT